MNVFLLVLHTHIQADIRVCATLSGSAQPNNMKEHTALTLLTFHLSLRIFHFPTPSHTHPHNKGQKGKGQNNFFSGNHTLSSNIWPNS